MRTALVCSLGLSVLVAAALADVDPVPRPCPETQPARPEGVDPDWWGTVQDDMARSEYHIRWQEGVGAYQSPNRAQNLRFTYRGDGFSAEPRAYDEEDSPWKLGMRLSAWGREDARRVFQPGELRVDANRATAQGRGVTLTYHNDRQGMRQDFLVRERPAGSGPLRLWLRLELDGVAAEVARDGGEVTFGRCVPGGARVMTYGDLKVQDAEGRLLPAEMVREGEELFAVLVDDAEAAYPILVDPLSTSPDWTAEGNQESAGFGAAVATAGDVNGDGYSDVVVGAPYYDNGETYEGVAFVYHGSATGLNTTPDWTAEGDQVGARFGRSVATAGDINGDGYSDLIVGAHYYDNGQTNEGRAYVYHGGASGLDASPSWTAESDQATAHFGLSVATAGDVNGDGHSDVIVGAYGYDNGQVNEGRAYVYHGSASGLATSADWTAEADLDYVYFGWSVATAGDVDGDGYSDVIVGACDYDNGETNEGRAYVYHGSVSGLATSADWTAEGNQENAYFGRSVAAAGDVNADGYGDVIVGSPFYDDGETNEGRAYVYHGSAAGLATAPTWTAEGGQGGAEFGASVATAGDVNGDGYSDVIIGAHYFDNGQPAEGRSYVYYGGPGGLAISPGWIAESDQASAYFGRSVATAGDVNGDGYSDVIIGASHYDDGEMDEGRAYIYHGGAAGLATSPFWIAEGDQAYARFGWSAAPAGDVNGDGYSDVVIGAYVYSNDQLSEGRAYVYHGSAGGLVTSSAWTAEGDEAAAYFGWSVATAGDVNGDGHSDVIVGAPGYGNAGRAYVYHGSAGGLVTSPAWTADGEQAVVLFGHSVARAGDVNGDGYGDVIVGTYAPGASEGRAYVYHGGPAGLGTSPAWTAGSIHLSDYFGYSVGSAGDVNGDGYSDIIVGAFGYPATAGHAYVYHGSDGGLGVSPVWTAQPEAGNDSLGISVGTAGDVNGDGYSDVIIGAPGHDNGQSNEGRAYVYHGSITGLATSPAWSAEADQTDAGFGRSVATAGDVNGDGYSDVIVGAHAYDNGQTDEGRAYVYHGSSTGLAASPAWTAERDQNDARLGWSVATAGDVSGDGYGDVVVGAWGYDSGETDEGQAYVFHGNDGGGLYVLPRQWRTDLVTPVVPALKTRSQTQTGLGLFARTFIGRSDIRVQFEVKPLDTPFDGTGLVTTGWVDPVASGATVDQVIGGLTDRTMYRWRTRVAYRLTDGAPQPYGRWIYQPYNGGLGEADFQVSDNDLPLNTPELHIDRMSADQCRLWWYPVPGALGYYLYRDTFAYTPPVFPWVAVAVPDTSYVFTDGVGAPATNYYFLCRSVGAWGESGDSNRVGEFDVGTATAVTGTAGRLE